MSREEPFQIGWSEPVVVMKSKKSDCKLDPEAKG